MNTRREVLRGALALTGMTLLPGCGIDLPVAQQPRRVPRIALFRLSPAPPWQLEAFHQGLREHGWIDGDTIVVEERYADGRSEALSEVAAKLLRPEVEVIVASGVEAILAAKQATSTTPIVMSPYGGDPVAGGVAESLGRPGGNVTGVANLGQLGGKRAELLKETLPGLSSLAVLWNTNNLVKIEDFRETQEAASAAGIQIRSFGVRRAEEIDGALSAIFQDAPGALMVFQEPIMEANRRRIIDGAIAHRLPSIFDINSWAEEGGLMSYGADSRDIYFRAAAYVDKILRGANPAVLPIERPVKFDFFINLRTAQAIGLTIPQPILQRATVIIQ